MIAEIDKKQIAVVADPVDPAGQPGFDAGVRGAEFAAVMGAVRVHARNLRETDPRHGGATGM